MSSYPKYKSSQLYNVLIVRFLGGVLHCWHALAPARRHLGRSGSWAFSFVFLLYIHVIVFWPLLSRRNGSLSSSPPFRLALAWSTPPSISQKLLVFFSILRKLSQSPKQISETPKKSVSCQGTGWSWDSAPENSPLAPDWLLPIRRIHPLELCVQ